MCKDMEAYVYIYTFEYLYYVYGSFLFAHLREWPSCNYAWIHLADLPAVRPRLVRPGVVRPAHGLARPCPAILGHSCKKACVNFPFV